MILFLLPSLAKCFSLPKLDATKCQNDFNIINFAPICKIVISISEIVMHLFTICEKNNNKYKTKFRQLMTK